MADITFEAAMKRLEEIIALLENGQLSLEESMKLFEEGTALADICGKKLNEAELKITQLQNIGEDK